MSKSNPAVETLITALNTPYASFGPMATAGAVQFMFDGLKQSKTAGFLEDIDAERNRLLKEVEAAPLSPDKATMALNSLRELGEVVYDSGIPQALLAFGLTYKLLKSLPGIDEEAQRKFKAEMRTRRAVYRVQDTNATMCRLQNGSDVEPLLTLADESGGIAILFEDDHCLVLAIRQEAGYYELTPWWFPEAVEAVWKHQKELSKVLIPA